MNELVRLCQEIYDTRRRPEDFLQSIIIPMKKKQNAPKCEDYRTISLQLAKDYGKKSASQSRSRQMPGRRSIWNQDGNGNKGCHRSPKSINREKPRA